MIYESMVTSINESEFDTLLENAEDRFENMTISEAGNIVLAEQEKNWTTFMEGVGLSELHSVMEGEEVIYEGGRLASFVEKAKAYFKMALNKLAQITKSFIAKVMQFVSTNNAFLKKYEKDLRNAGTIEYKGYAFSSKLDAAQKFAIKDAIKSGDDANEQAQRNFPDVGYDDDKSFGERAKDVLYGEDGKEEREYKVSDQVTILRNTKNIKQSATKNYKQAAKDIKKIIKDLESKQAKALKDDVKNKTDVEDSNKTNQDLGYMISYWKAYANCLLTYHSKYMQALGTRNRQAKAICTKALTKGYKAKGQSDRNRLRKGAGMDEKVYKEGAVDTEAFLGAVNFI